MEFQSQLLKNPLNFRNVDSYLYEIEKITHFIYKKIDLWYEFYNKETYLSIKDIINSEEHAKWCKSLAEYYYIEADNNLLQNNHIISCNYYFSSAYYYTEVLQHENAAFIYYKAISVLISVMQYDQALLAITRLESICKDQHIKIPSKLKENLVILKATCLYSIFHFKEAAIEYEKYMKKIDRCTYEFQKIYCQYAICLYNAGEIEQPYQILTQLYSELSDDILLEENAELIVNILSNLSSIEETLGIKECSDHFNLALSYAHDYNLTETYYSLLRKSFIVHSGINYMQMLESARNYYKTNGAKKDYAMTLHNLASFHLLYGDMDNIESDCVEAIKIFSEIGSDSIHYTYNCIGMYYCIQGDYYKALSYFRQAYKERYELFSKITILLNQINTHMKLGNFICAEQIMKYIETLWKQGEAEAFCILKPYHYIIKASLYQKMKNVYKSYKSYMNYFEYENERDNYRFIFATKKFHQLCCENNSSFPVELEPYIKSGNTIADRLLNLDLLPVHLMFAE